MRWQNTIEQLKNDIRSLTAPLDNLQSNWAYMVMASLAWSLKAWSALLVPERGRWQEKHRQEKRRFLRMDFSTFRNAWINMPAQIVRTSRRIVYRFLSRYPWQCAFFRLLDALNVPLRCRAAAMLTPRAEAGVRMLRPAAASNRRRQKDPQTEPTKNTKRSKRQPTMPIEPGAHPVSMLQKLAFWLLLRLIKV